MRTLMVALAAAIALATLAGCSEPATAPTPTAEGNQVLAPQAGTFHFPDGALAPAGCVRMLAGAYYTGQGASEPSIGSDSKGHVFMTADVSGPVTSSGGPSVVMTTDGQSFTDVGPKLPTGGQGHPITLDTLVYVDRDTGRIFFDDILPLSCTVLSWSDDVGKSWTTNPYGCGNSQVNDHETLVTAKPRMLSTVGYPKVLYTCFNNVGYEACATSLDGGLTFGPQVAVREPATSSPDGTPNPLCSALTGHLKAAPDGTVFLPSTACPTQDSVPVVSVTQDDGLTWTTHVISDVKASDHETAIAVDDAGTVYATWPGADGFLHFAFSTDDGSSWSDAINVTAPGVTATGLNAVVAGAPGQVAFAYIGTRLSGGYDNDLSDEKAWASATWDSYLGIITNATSAHPTIQSAPANDPADPVARGVCGRTRCNGMYDFIEVTIDNAGRPWASFVDVCNDKCSHDAKAADSGALGLMATLRSGPSLRLGGALPELAAPPVPKQA